MRPLILNERTARYPDEEFYPLTGGPGGTCLTDQICRKLELSRGQRVLDLGAGHFVSSIFIAREYGCTVFAYDLWVEAGHNLETVKRYHLEDQIVPLHGDARDLPFAPGYFDRIFSMDSYFYYGGSPEFARYIAQYLKPEGLLGFGEWCPIAEDRREQMWSIYGKGDRPASDDSLVHSPAWWKELLERNGDFTVLHSALAEMGFEMLIDWIQKTYALGMIPPWGGYHNERDMLDDLNRHLNARTGCKSHHVTVARRNKQQT